MTNHTPDDDKPYWLDDPRNVDKVVWTLYGICALLMAFDVFIDRHGEFEIEHAFGFYGFYGFFGSVGLVLTAKQLRRVLMRPEGYYDR